MTQQYQEYVEQRLTNAMADESATYEAKYDDSEERGADGKWSSGGSGAHPHQGNLNKAKDLLDKATKRHADATAEHAQASVDADRAEAGYQQAAAARNDASDAHGDNPSPENAAKKAKAYKNFEIARAAHVMAKDEASRTHAEMGRAKSDLDTATERHAAFAKEVGDSIGSATRQQASSTPAKPAPDMSQAVPPKSVPVAGPNPAVPYSAGYTSTRIDNEPDENGDHALIEQHANGYHRIKTGIRVASVGNGQHFAHLLGKRLTPNMPIGDLKAHIDSSISGLMNHGMDNDLADAISRGVPPKSVPVAGPRGGSRGGSRDGSRDGYTVTHTKVSEPDANGDRTLHLGSNKMVPQATQIKIGTKDGRYFAHHEGKKLTGNMPLGKLKAHIDSRLVGTRLLAMDHELAGHIARKD